MVTQNIRLGNRELKLIFALESAKKRIFSTNELAKILGISKARTNKICWQLQRKNRLIRIRKGEYLFAPMKAGGKGYWSEETLAVVSQILRDKPYYVSFWAAMNHYGLTEQIPSVTQVVLPFRKRNFPAFGMKFEFVRLKELGEFKEVNIAGQKVNMATLEQLIIDCLAHPEYCGGMAEACKALWYARDKLNWEKLKQLSFKSKDVVRRRLGYLLDLLELPNFLSKTTFSGWRYLDPSRKKIQKGKAARWGLVLNLNEADLTYWKES